MKSLVRILTCLLVFVGCNSSSQESSHKRIMEMNDFMGELWSLPSDSVAKYVEVMDTEMKSFTDKEKGFYYLLKTQYAKQMGNSMLQKKWAQQGISYCKAAHDDTTLIPLLMVISDFHFQRNQYDSAIYHGHKALQLADSIDYHIAGSAMILSNAYHGTKNYSKARHYLLLALLNDKDSLYRGSIYTNLSINCNHLHDLSGGSEYSKKAIEFHKRNGDHYNLCLAYGSSASQLSQNGNYQDGLTQIEKAIEIAEKHELEIPENFDIYGDLLYMDNRHTEAEKAYQKSIEIFKSLEDSIGIISPYQGMASMLKAQERWDQTIAYMDSVNSLTERGYKNQLADKVTEAEFQVRDERINSLKSQRNLEEERGEMKNVIILLIVFLALITILTFRLYFTRKQFKQKIEVMTLKQQLMRTQMTPHFIFNSISSLQGLIITGKKEEANYYLGSFAQILRGSIENSTKQCVPVSNEIKVIRNYIQLQQIRYNSKFDYQIGVDSDTEELLITPMIIQPFVENAIEHGLKPIKHQGKLNITLSIDKGSTSSVVCRIKDNGGGFKPSQFTSDRNSLSTTIIKEQLELLAENSGSRSELLIQSDKNGTEVTIYIPFEEFE